MMEDLLKLQKNVDELIQNKINISFNQTLNDRKIAFKVELSELANEIGFFKYWKQSHVKNHERIKDEWADCLAILLSIVISMNFEKELIHYSSLNDIKPDHKNNNYMFNELNFNKMYDLVDITTCLYYLYKIGLNNGYTMEELNEAYIIKTSVNIIRAKEGY